MKCCVKCKNSEEQFSSRFFHNHHIIYDPEDIAVLCMQCHYVITKLNGFFVRAINGYETVKRKLNNEERYRIWELFLNETPISMNRHMVKHFAKKTDFYKEIIEEGENNMPLGGRFKAPRPQISKRLGRNGLHGFWRAKNNR